MSFEELKEYVRIVADMENSIFMQKGVIEELTRKRNKYGIPQTINAPYKPKEAPEGGNGMGFIYSIISFIGFVLCIEVSTKTREGVQLLFGFLGFGCLIFSIILFITAIIGVSLGAAEKVDLKKQNEKYEIELRTYNGLVEADRKRLNQEKPIIDYLEAEIMSARTQLNISMQRLDSMYNLGIIFPKYRNFVMVNTIYEYLQTGRCTTLDGASGAYNKLEEEMRLNMIIWQLDRVINNLESIRQNQFNLYCAINESNNRMNGIINSCENLSNKMDGMNANLSRLQASSELTAYNAERARKELEFMNRMQYFERNNINKSLY